MIQIERVKTKEQLNEAFRIRKDVFVREQGIAEEIEIDEYEDKSEHVLACYNHKAVGTGRVRQAGDQAKLERICVLESHRKHKLGKAIMDELEAIAREMGLNEVKLHSQMQAAGFYEKLRYRTASAPFLEENIPHVRMTKQL